MNDVCDTVVGETKEHEPADRLLYPFTQMDKLDVDKVFMRIANRRSNFYLALLGNISKEMNLYCLKSGKTAP